MSINGVWDSSQYQRLISSPMRAHPSCFCWFNALSVVSVIYYYPSSNVGEWISMSSRYVRTAANVLIDFVSRTEMRDATRTRKFKRQLSNCTCIANDLPTQSKDAVIGNAFWPTPVVLRVCLSKKQKMNRILTVAALTTSATAFPATGPKRLWMYLRIQAFKQLIDRHTAQLVRGLFENNKQGRFRKASSDMQPYVARASWRWCNGIRRLR